MFMKQGVGGEAGAPKKETCIGRDSESRFGGCCVKGKKGVKSSLVSKWTPQVSGRSWCCEKRWGAFGRNFVGGHDYSVGSR